MTYQSRIFRRKLLASSISSCLLASGAIHAQQTVGMEEEVIVRGIRSSLERSIDIKRESSQLVEAITAEDLGKMPDQNITESLQRLPGIQIDRVNGEGSKVRIRGLDQNSTLLNGETFISGMEYYQQGESSVEYDNSLEGVPAEILGGVNVYKSPVASLTESGIGGVIDLQTRNALDLKQRVIAGNVKIDQGADSGDAQPSASLIIGNNWNDTFAAIFSISASNRTVSNGSIQNYSRNAWIERSLSDGSTYLNSGMTYVTDTLQERNRVGGSLSLEWAPTEALELGFNWFHNEMDITKADYSVKHDMGVDGTPLDETLPYSIDGNGVLLNGSFSATAAENNTATQVSDVSADNFALNLDYDNGGQWRFNGNIAAASAELESNSGFADSYFAPWRVQAWTGDTAVIDSNGDGNLDAASPTSWYTQATNVVAGDDGIRRFDYTTGSKPKLDYSDSYYFTDPAYLSYKSAFAHGDKSQNDFFAAKFDAEVDIEFGDLKTLSFGFRTAEKEIDFKEYRYLIDLANNGGVSLVDFDPSVNPGFGAIGVAEFNVQDMCGNGGECDIDNDGIDDNLTNGTATRFLDPNLGLNALALTTSTGISVFEAITGITGASGRNGPGAMSPAVIGSSGFADDPSRYTRVKDFFPDGGYQSDILFQDAGKMENAEAWFTGIAGNNNVGKYENVLESWAVVEKTNAAYLEADLEGNDVPYRLNLGVRVINTEVEVTATTSVADAEEWGTDGWNGVPKTFDRSTTKNDYWDFLPNMNLSLDLREDSMLRFSAAKVMNQANLQSLGKGYQRQYTIDLNTGGSIFQGGSSGNPELDPYRATQFDLAFEHYFGDIGYFSSGLFYKGVKSFPVGVVVQVTEQDGSASGSSTGGVTTQGNGTGGVVQGLELAYQMSFSNGLGFTANYTYSDSSTDSDSVTREKLSFPGVSENAYNLIGFYENDKLSARLAYTWRDEYLSPLRSSFSIQGKPGNYAEFYDAYGQWDASISYDIMDALSLTAEAINMTGEGQSSFLEYSNNFMSYVSQEPRINLGLSFRF